MKWKAHSDSHEPEVGFVPGQDAGAKDQVGQDVPSTGPAAVPGKQSIVDWQKPQSPEFVQAGQRPMATLVVSE